MNSSIVIDELSFRYRGASREALKQVQAEIPHGSFVVIMGPSGSGRSSLCYALNGLIPHFFRGEYLGKVTVLGKVVQESTISEMARIVGLVFEDYEAQLFRTNAELEVAFGLENLGLSVCEMRRRVKQYLSMVGLQGLEKRHPGSLSGGQKQRLALASVMAMEPIILVLDEPTTDLDFRARREILDVAIRLKERGTTLVVAENDPQVAMRAEQVWLMGDGRLLAKGKPQDVLWDSVILASLGLRPPGVWRLFQALGWKERPKDFGETKAVLKARGIVPRDTKERAHPRNLRQDAPSGQSFIEIENLTYTYPGRDAPAIRDIDLRIATGEFVAILGENGSGKSTLALSMTGLIKPQGGEVRIQGRALRELQRKDLARTVGHVFQNPDHQIFCRTVKEEIAYGMRLQGASREFIERRVEELMEVVGLEGKEDLTPFSLSRGDRQRVAVASTLAPRPQVLILDEPTTGLDPREQEALMRVLSALNKEGHTIVIITHALELALRYANRVVVMQGGRIVLDGPSRWVMAQEDLLVKAGLEVPDIVRLSNYLNMRSLAPEDLAAEISRELHPIR